MGSWDTVLGIGMEKVNMFLGGGGSADFDFRFFQSLYIALQSLSLAENCDNCENIGN